MEQKGKRALTDDDTHTLQVALGTEQLQIRRRLAQSCLGIERLLDLIVLELDERVGAIPIRMEARQDLDRLLVLAVLDEEARALGHEPHEAELDNGGDHLEDGGDAP